jgi:hypothetical protein
MASQFADLYEKVDGTNTYSVALAIATGNTPVVKKQKTVHKIAASCVLRKFEDHLVTHMPNAEEIAKTKQCVPDIRIVLCAKEGVRLISLADIQDGNSYRYAFLNIGALDHHDLNAKLTECVKHLNFQFSKD